MNINDQYEKFICISDEFKENFNELSEAEQNLTLNILASSIASTMRKIRDENN